MCVYVCVCVYIRLLKLVDELTYPGNRQGLINLQYNGRGISFYAFGFSLAENLSAQCMGYLGATLTQLFTRAGEADVSLRDVTIAQMGNGYRECG